jgi:uncharacterized protein (TIGR02246 family)
MKTALLALLLALPARDHQRSAAPPSDDEAAIRDVVAWYVDTRALRDPKAIDALFTDDADQHTTSGEWRRGRREVVPGTLDSSARNPGTRRIVLAAVRFITSDVAIADGPYEITGGNDVRRMSTTIVLRRQDGSWRIAAIRNMVPTGAAATSR